MAKKRQKPKSAFDNTSKEELKEVGKNILKKAGGNEELAPPAPPPAKKPVRRVKNKIVYLSEDTHRMARRKAVLKDMNIKEYVTYLIENDDS